MILERLYIENYKQLHDPLELYPPEGAIGVIGRNGSGKSSLFESILWAFFGSRGGGPRFSNELIPWSGGSAKDPTVVEVTLALGDDSYTVRRQLKSGSTAAEARDGSGKTIVEGSSDVTRWVEENLLGMDRTAFEATFFARQKELRFFAHDDGINRVRRVSRMLGISRVEDAQKLLREDRNQLRSEVRVLESRLDAADPAAIEKSLEEQRAGLHRVEEELDRVVKEMERAREELNAAREARAALETSYREHNRLSGELRKAEGDRDRAADRASAAEQELEELDAAEEELGRLRPQISRLPDLTEKLEALEEERRRVERREAARAELLEARKRISRIESGVWDILEDLDGRDEEPVEGWDALFELDGPELLEETARALERAAGSLEQAEQRHEKLRELREGHEELRRAEEEARRAREGHDEARREVDRLAAETEDVSGGEDLERREDELRQERQKLLELASGHRARNSADEQEAGNVDKALKAIESGVEDHCPTCRRPFVAGEQDEILDTLRRQAASLRRRAAREKEKTGKLTASAEAAGERLEKVSGKLGRWRELREALGLAQERARARLEALENARERVRGLEERVSETAAPTDEELQDARGRCERLQALRDARPGVESLAREHASLRRRAEALSSELETLDGAAYEARVHEELREEKDRLERGRGRCEELERRVRRRPGIERALEEARERARAAEARAAGLRREVSVLGFDEGEYEAAANQVTETEEKLSRLRDAREHLGNEWKDAEHLIDTLTGELKRFEAERKLAGEQAAAASRMDEMDVLFTEFFRSLTSRVRPTLENEASSLVRDLTDGRYERLEFDDNYRVRLLDRFDDSYAIERFSGGEADVASLSARVALSKIIAARSSETLGFLVLDEVFGSLDDERRNNVLLALERLKKSFGQIFVISHVGEVQEAALVDEVWMLEEDEDGKSTVRRAGQDPAAPLIGEVSSG